VALDQLEPAVVADRVGDPRAHDVRDHSDRRHSEQAVLAVVHVESREQHRGLRRDRDARALERHQQEDPGQAEIADHVRRELGELVRDGGQDEHQRRRRVPLAALKPV
jgi:hypothetical protein